MLGTFVPSLMKRWMSSDLRDIPTCSLRRDMTDKRPTQTLMELAIDSLGNYQAVLRNPSLHRPFHRYSLRLFDARIQQHHQINLLQP